MSQAGGPSSHVIAEGVIPIRADLAPMEDAKRQVERQFAELADTLAAGLEGVFTRLPEKAEPHIGRIRDMVKAALLEPLEEFERRIAAVQLPQAPQQQATTAPPQEQNERGQSLASVAEQILNRVSEGNATLEEIRDQVDNIALAMQEEPD
jgi:hypothetical protein